MALGALAHDPEGRLLAKLPSLLERFVALYAHVVVVITPPSAAGWAGLADGPRFLIIRATVDGVGANRRQCILAASAAQVDAVHYCDLDRVIFWMTHFESELAAILPRLADHPYTILGRTEQAFASHPLAQQLPERATNEAISAALGHPVDVTAGSTAMRREIAPEIARRSRAPGGGTDAEWPLIAALQLGVRPGYLRVNGLGFETADFFQHEIERAGGRDAWVRQRYDTFETWLTRVALANETILEAARVLEESRHTQEG